MRAGVAISSIGHAVVLGWGLIAFAPAAFDTPPAESMPVDLVPITDLTQLQAGNKDAPKKEQAKQTGEIIGLTLHKPAVSRAIATVRIPRAGGNGR